MVQLFYTCAVVTCIIQSYDFWEAVLESQGIYNKATEIVGKFSFPLHLHTSVTVDAFSVDVHGLSDRNREAVMQTNVFHIGVY